MSDGRELPTDPGLPLLAAFAEHGAREVLGRHGLAPVGALRVLGHHAGRRMALGDEDDLIVKAYDRHPVAMVELLRRFEAAGLAGPEPPMATRLLADDPELAMVVTPRFPGPSGRDLIGADEPERAAALAAAWVRAIATADVAGHGPDRGPRFLAGQAETWAAQLRDGGLRQRAAQVVRRLADAPPPEKPRVLVHTSFGPRHVIALPGGPGVYDWDGFGRGRLELDVATFLVTTDRAAKDPERLRAARRAQAALLEEVAGIVDPDVLEWHRAVMLVKHAWRMSNAASTRWPERAGALLDAALAARGP